MGSTPGVYPCCRRNRKDGCGWPKWRPHCGSDHEGDHVLRPQGRGWSRGRTVAPALQKVYGKSPVNAVINWLSLVLQIVTSELVNKTFYVLRFFVIKIKGCCMPSFKWI